MEANKIENILKEEDIWCDCYETDGKVYAEIDGDWKHDHLKAKLLLEEYGYTMVRVYEEESDSDWYFARYVVL